jgi:hypothetical protein
MDIRHLLAANPSHMAFEHPAEFENRIREAVADAAIADALCDGFARLAFGCDASDLHEGAPPWVDDAGARSAFAFIAAAGALAAGVTPASGAIRRAFLGANIVLADGDPLLGEDTRRCPARAAALAAAGAAGRRTGQADVGCDALAGIRATAAARLAGTMTPTEAVAAVVLLAVAPAYPADEFAAAADRALSFEC